MLYWEREQDLQNDLQQAIERFRIRYGSDPSILLINKEEVEEFASVSGSLKIKEDKLMNKKHFGLL